MSAYYLARQPILDSSGNTFGYELLFRSTEKNVYDPSVDGDTATARLLVNTIVEAGLESIVGSAQAFVNLTQRFLENPEILDLLEPGRYVLEVLETVDVSDKVVAGVEMLRARGHTIALDDFVDADRFARLLPLAHIIKYDITQHTMDQLAEYRLADTEAGRLSLAERVETLDQFNALKEAGFQYFQGYYFSRPHVISGTKLSPSKLVILQLLKQISDPATTIEELAEQLSHDVALSVRTLRYVNSPLSGLNSEITSISHAAVMLGRDPIRNWVMLLLMSGVDNKPAELIKMALIRARFCQLLAKEKGLDNNSMYFTIGLLSLIDVLMETDLEIVLAEMAISEEIRNPLLKGAGEGGEMLRLIKRLEEVDPVLNSGEEYLGAFYQDAIAWTEDTIGLL